MIKIKKKFGGVLILFLVITIVLLGFASACHCGDGVINQQSEECDWGELNGYLCWAGYGSSCTYCTITCKLKTITNYCGDGILNPACEECDDGNLINGDGCSDKCEIEEPPEPECDHEIAIRYNYVDTFDTGIGISEDDIWLDNPIVLIKEGEHSIKYRIENKKDDDDNVHIIVKLDDEIITQYTKMIDSFHYNNSVSLDISDLQCNSYHSISLEIESDGFECDLTDNYAEREIYIECEEPPIPYCGDGECNGDENCSSCPQDCGECPPACPVCGNGILETGEECDDGNLINNDGCSNECKIEEDDEDDENDDGVKKEIEFVQYCDTNWECTGWGVCSNGITIRHCYDKNKCDIEYNKPLEQMGCESLSKVYIEEDNGKSFWIILGIVLFIILVMIIINLV